MAKNPGDLLPSAKDLMTKIATAEADKAAQEMRRQSAADAEKAALIEQLSRPSGVSDEEGIRRAMLIINRAANNGLTEVQVYRFPNSLCTDGGRAINQQEPGWEQTLTGVPREIYVLWSKYFRERGFKLRTQIIEFPTFVQTVKWTRDTNEGHPINEEMGFNSKEGMQIYSDVSLSYAIEPAKVPEFYVKYRVNNLDLFTHVILRDIGDENATLFQGALADQALAHSEVRGKAIAFVGCVGGEQFQGGFIFAGIGEIEGSALRIHQGRQLRQQQLRYSEQIALALHHAGELGNIGF